MTNTAAAPALDAVLALLAEHRDMARRDYETATLAVTRAMAEMDDPEMVESHERWRTLREICNTAHRIAGRSLPAPFWSHTMADA